MDEVDDILNHDREPEDDIEEDEDDDEEEDTMLDGNITKVNNIHQDQDRDRNRNHEDDVDMDGNVGGDDQVDDDDDDDDDEEDDDDDGDDDDDDEDDDDDDDDEEDDDEEDDDEEDDEEDDGDDDAESNQRSNANSVTTGAQSEHTNDTRVETNSKGQENGTSSAHTHHQSDLSDENINPDRDNLNKDGVTEADKHRGLNKSNGIDEVHNYYTQMLRSAKIADTYNIYPTAAIPIQTNVNALSMSKGLEYLFLGGDDGFIRKYDFLNTVDGKLSLTILQKHSLAESIQNAGILLSYWENEIPQKRSELKMLKNNKEYEPKVSPVHSLEVQNECLFILSGLSNGGITLQGVRYMEGSISHYFKGKQGHSNIVNLLRMNDDEKRFLSGSWDRKILEWDLQSGNLMNEFKGSTSELSSLEMRPLFSTVDINDVAAKLKQEKMNDGTGKNEQDDDMDSLFGDEDEEKADSSVHADQVEKPEDKKSINYSEEISRTTLNVVYDDSVFMSSGLNGTVHIWDRRVPSAPVLNLERGPKVPPWCQSACWCMDGDRVYAGRRNATVEEFELKMPSMPSNVLKLPAISGPVTCVRAMPNNKQILCASRDNIRLYNTANNINSKGTAVPFLIVPGHHGGVISNMYVDPTCRFLISTSGNRGWQGSSTDTTFIYEIDLN